MDRLFTLSNKGRLWAASIIIFIVVFVFIIIGIENYYGASDKIIGGTLNISAVSLPSIIVVIILFFREKKEDIAFIEANLDNLINNLIPSMIRVRDFGEPFDLKAMGNTRSLMCDVYHKSGSPHAGYKVRYENVEFEFTMIITMYRATLFVFVPNIRYNDAMASAIKDVSENLLNCDFKMYYEHFGDPNDENVKADRYTVVYIRRELDSRFSDLIVSTREQYMFARELTEWCRSVIRKLKYDDKKFRTIKVPTSSTTSTLPDLPP